MSDNARSGEQDDIHPPHSILKHLAIAGQWDRLLQMARVRLEQRVDDGIGHRAAALALIHLQRADEAGVHVDFLLRKDPDFYYHHQLAAQAAIQKMEMRRAKLHLEAALQDQPENDELHRLMGMVLAVLGESDKAAEHTNQSQELAGDIKESWLARELMMAGRHRESGSWRERIRALQAALVHDPGHPWIAWRVGNLLLELEQPRAAKIWLSRALAADPQSRVFARDWQEACERSHLIYRCLSYPWRSLKWLMIAPTVFKLRPALFFPLLLLLPFWLLILAWWLASWIFLAPVGGLIRHFLFVHPAFDLTFWPRHWVRHQSLTVRLLLLAGTAAAVGLVAGWLVPALYLQYGLILAALQGFVQWIGTLYHVTDKRNKRPWPPDEWLAPDA